MRRCLAVLTVLLACGTPSPGGDAHLKPVMLGAQPFPAQPDGGVGQPLASLWVLGQSSDGALHRPAMADLQVTCTGGCDVVRVREVQGGPQGVLAVIVDDSGSNTVGPELCAGCPTDPEGKRILAVQALFRSLLHHAPQWRIGLFDFGANAHPSIFRNTNHLAGYTSRLADLVDGAEQLRSGGATYLYESIGDVQPTVAGERRTFLADQPDPLPMRVLVVSDGEDTSSNVKLDAVLDAGAQLGVSVDCVGYGALDGGVYPNLAGKAYRDLRTIGVTSGGLVTLVSRDELEALFTRLGESYAVGWLEVVVARPNGAAIDGTLSLGREAAAFHVE